MVGSMYDKIMKSIILLYNTAKNDYTGVHLHKNGKRQLPSILIADEKLNRLTHESINVSIWFKNIN
jgi:hypothetical protein